MCYFTRKRIIIQIICLVSLLFLVETTTLKATPTGNVLHTWKTNNPILDGNLNENPWRETSWKKVNLYYANQSIGLSLTVYALHSNQTLYIGLNIPLTNVSSFVITLIFRTNYSEPLWIDNNTLGSGHDIKQIVLFPELILYDYHSKTINGSTILVADSIIDISAAYQNATNFFSVELSLPLNSTDPSGCDPDLVKNKTLDLFLGPFFDLANNYSQFRFMDNTYDFLTINMRHLRQRSFSTLIFGLPISLITVSNILVVLYFVKKKKK